MKTATLLTLAGALFTTACADAGTAPAFERQMDAAVADAGLTAVTGTGSVTASWSAVADVKSYNLHLQGAAGTYPVHYAADAAVNGRFTHTFSNLPAGSYQLCLKLQAQSTKWDDACLTLSVAGAPTAVATQLTLAGNGTITYGDAPAFTVTLTTAAGALAGQSVALNFGDASCSAITDASGKATCAPAALLPAGAYPVSASFAGADDFLASVAGPLLLTVEPKPVAVDIAGGALLLGMPTAFPCVATARGFIAPDQAQGTASCGVAGISVAASGVGTYRSSYLTGLSAGSNYTIGAGNDGTFVVTYAPVASGFRQPLLAAGVRTEFKAGSNVPLKFRVFYGDGVTPVTNAVAGAYANGTFLGTFRYDAGGAQYIYNLDSSRLSAGVEYVVEARLDDGQVVSGLIVLVKGK